MPGRADVLKRIYVMADPVRLGQCFSNPFSNAAKYTNLGGRIEVSLARDEDGAVVRVRDNGVGMGSELVVRLPALDGVHDAPSSAAAPAHNCRPEGVT
jgi:signal transduction histidine kinase